MAAGIIVVLFVLSLIGLMWVTKNSKKHYAVAKGCASLLFVLAGIVFMVMGHSAEQAMGTFFIGALVLCMAGDVLLGIANSKDVFNNKMFALGGLSFAMAHVIFCVFYYLLSGIYWWDIVVPLVLALVLIVLQITGVVVLGKFSIISYGYTVLVGLVAAKTMQVYLYGTLEPMGGVLSAVGGALFLVSDIILLFLYFGKKKNKWLRYANLLTYYIGVFLLSTTTYWF